MDLQFPNKINVRLDITVQQEVSGVLHSVYVQPYHYLQIVKFQFSHFMLRLRLLPDPPHSR